MRFSPIFLSLFGALNVWAQDGSSVATMPAAPATAAAPAREATIETEFDALGGNRILLERAKALEPETRAWIVQNRMVPRDHRFEFAPEYSGTLAGDTYNRTQSIGMNVHYHFNPRWSVGLKYNKSFNQVTPEGEALVKEAIHQFRLNPSRASIIYPDIDYPKQETMGLVNWYPVYGKMNIFDRGVAHFDLYLLGGVGTVQLASGSASTQTAGGGIGFWLNPQISTRLELRYQTYTAQSQGGARDLGVTVGSMQVGWLL